MTNDVETAGGSHFKDRKTGLVVFGILEIFFGYLLLRESPCFLFSKCPQALLP